MQIIIGFHAPFDSISRNEFSISRSIELFHVQFLSQERDLVVNASTAREIAGEGHSDKRSTLLWYPTGWNE